jgi:putative spermidine/putrescine transport system permease protein
VALLRFVKYGKGLIRALALSPLILPVIVTAIALFDIMTRLDLVGSFWGLLLSHTVLALPFPVFILENALKSVDPNLEDAAVSLGASRLKAFYKVTIPLIVPSIFGAALFAFLASWDEVVIVLFVGGALLQTLPVQMFQFLTTEVRPTIASASTLLIAAILLGMLLMRVFRSRRWAIRRPI